MELLETEFLMRLLAALVLRAGSGVVRFVPREIARAPVDMLRISRDATGDLWLDFKPASNGLEDTWPIEE